MNIRRLTGVLSLVLLAGFILIPAAMADNGTDRENDLARIRKKVEALRAWQLTEVLDLDEETSSRLFSAMRKADEERWKIEARNRALLKEMARSVEKNRPEPKRINNILDELQANRRELIRAEERHLEKARQILSPADTARYLMFQIRFQREIRQRAAEAISDRRDLQDSRDRENRDRAGPGDGGSGSSGSDGGSGSGGRRR